MRNFLRNSGTDVKVRGKVAVLVPTYRFDSRARHALAAAASLANDDVAVLIGDNSENAAKRKFLETLATLHSNIHVYCHKVNIGASRNWRFLFDRAELPYLFSIGDDDIFTPSYLENAMRLIEQHDDAAAASGPFIMITSSNQMIRGNGARLEATPYDRCTNFPIGGGNSLPSSICSRQAAQRFVQYTSEHPLKASFFDWLLSYTMLSLGKYYAEADGCYFYDMSNWENGAACWNSNAKFYVASGLPESFTWFHELYWAVEFVQFFRGSHSPMRERDQRDACAQFFYLNRIREFRRACDHPSHASALEHLISHYPAAVEAMRRLRRNDDAFHPELFNWFSEVLAAFDRNCAVAYADFVNASLDSAEITGSSQT